MPVEDESGVEPVTVPDLLESLRARVGAGETRLLVGIAGSPGAGKSTLAVRLVEAWNRSVPEDGPTAAYVPMDGFHLANVELARLDRGGRKGAPDTFDAPGYVALLRRLRADGAETVWAPMFDRSLEEPIAGAIAVEPSVRLVVTEGNYLLLDQPPWDGVAELLHERWFLVVPERLRVARLVARHEAFGRTAADARAWAATTDGPNARRVEGSRGRADRLLAPVPDDGGSSSERG